MYFTFDDSFDSLADLSNSSNIRFRSQDLLILTLNSAFAQAKVPTAKPIKATGIVALRKDLGNFGKLLKSILVFDQF